MIRYVAIAALVACCGLLAVLMYQMSENSDLEAENGTLRRNDAVREVELSDARLAASVAAARAKLATSQAVEAARSLDRIKNIDLGVCGDAEIGVDLSDIFSGVPRKDD